MQFCTSELNTIRSPDYKLQKIWRVMKTPNTQVLCRLECSYRSGGYVFCKCTLQFPFVPFFFLCLCKLFTPHFYISFFSFFFFCCWIQLLWTPISGVWNGFIFHIECIISSELCKKWLHTTGKTNKNAKKIKCLCIEKEMSAAKNKIIAQYVGEYACSKCFLLRLRCHFNAFDEWNAVFLSFYFTLVPLKPLSTQSIGSRKKMENYKKTYWMRT